jgi:hypothetical protein
MTQAPTCGAGRSGRPQELGMHMRSRLEPPFRIGLRGRYGLCPPRSDLLAPGDLGRVPVGGAHAIAVAQGLRGTTACACGRQACASEARGGPACGRHTCTGCGCASGSHAHGLSAGDPSRARQGPARCMVLGPVSAASRRRASANAGRERGCGQRLPAGCLPGLQALTGVNPRRPRAMSVPPANLSLSGAVDGGVAPAPPNARISCNSLLDLGHETIMRQEANRQLGSLFLGCCG